VSKYDPAKNEWQDVAEMNYGQAYFGCTVLKGRIYVTGLSKFEVYNPTADQWTELPPPTACSTGRRLATIDRKIYSFGGSVSETEEYKGIATVEYFDLTQQKWIRVTDMNIPRCDHRVAVVRDSN